LEAIEVLVYGRHVEELNTQGGEVGDLALVLPN
jgi:hypothetical protein